MKHLAAIFLTTLILSGKIFSQTAPEPVFLELGQTIEKPIAAQEKHFYKVRLEAGQFVKIEVLPKNCDIAATFYALDEKHALDGKNDAGKNGSEILNVAVKESGEYKFRIISAEKEGAGSYQLKISEKRAATEKEFSYSAGKLIMSKTELLVKADATAENMNFALQEFQKAIEFFRISNSQKMLAVALDNSGVISSRLGNQRKALKFHLAALEVFRMLGDKKQQTFSLNNIGRRYSLLGDREKAIEILTEAVNLAREIKHSKNEATALNGIGSVYGRMKDYDKAEIFHAQALPIFQAEKDVYNQAITLNYLGNVYTSKNQIDKAIESYEKALELEKTLTGREANPSFLNNLGKAYGKKGDWQKALELTNQALEISLKKDDKSNQAFFIDSAASIYYRTGKFEDAEANLEKSLELYRSLEDVSRLAEVLYNLAAVENASGKSEEARTHIEEAVKILEDFGSGINSGELRDSISGTFYDYYTLYTEILLKLNDTEPAKGFDKLAWLASEGGRARNFLSLLNESKADIYEGADKDLLAKEREIYGFLNARLENLTQLLSGKNSPDEVAKLRSEIENIRTNYQVVRAKIREKSPRYAALTEPKILSVEEIQSRMLDENTTLLSYKLGAEKSRLWMITKNNFRVYELPKRAIIEEKTRRAYELLTARNKKIKFETPEEKRARIAEADEKLPQSLQDLGEILLKPAGSFSAERRLLIIADGVLQYLPFGVLRVNNRYLTETNETVNLPSASALDILQREKQARKPAPKTVAVLADPVFDARDERFSDARNKTNVRTDAVSIRSVSFEDSVRSMRDTNGEEFNISRLPYTRNEAEAIAKFVSPDNRKIVLDFAATRKFALSDELNQYRIVHFATHGFLNGKNPESSGLVMSLVDENGNSVNGFLRADELYNMKLSADLVVLSGCKTGLGKDVRGEGITGMTRGLMYAGAARVMVSLWDVNDQATADLMSAFYKNLLVKKDSPARSLRQTQISMMADKNFSHPYFWSSFVLQGQP